MTKPAFKLKRVTRRDRRNTTLDQFNLSQQESSILGLVGLPNSGKSTVIHLLAGLDKPTAGLISVLEGSPLQASIRSRIAIALDSRLLDLTTPAGDTLFQISRLKGLSLKVSRQLSEQLLDDLRLTSDTATLVGDLSTSSRQLLCAGTALIGEPEVLLFDDALDDLNEADQSILAGILRSRASQGCTAVIASRPLAMLEDLCDDIALLHQGTLLGKAAPGEICASLRGLLFKYEIDGDQTQSVDWQGVEARSTGTCTHVLSEHDILDKLLIRFSDGAITEITPNLDEACSWILRHPEAIATRSRMWGQVSSGLNPTD